MGHGYAGTNLKDWREKKALYQRFGVCVENLRNSQLLRAISALTGHILNLNLHHPELLEVP